MKLIKDMRDYLFEIFIWFLFLWMSALAITCAYLFPRNGITSLVAATLLTFVPKLYKKFKKTKEED